MFEPAHPNDMEMVSASIIFSAGDNDEVEMVMDQGGRTATYVIHLEILIQRPMLHSIIPDGALHVCL